jgi:hypothetical protein
MCFIYLFIYLFTFVFYQFSYVLAHMCFDSDMKFCKLHHFM